MDPQKKQPTASQKVEPVSSTIASADFERWAKAVRQQMLDCLKKRTGR